MLVKFCNIEPVILITDLKYVQSLYIAFIAEVPPFTFKAGVRARARGARAGRGNRKGMCSKFPFLGRRVVRSHPLLR